MICIHDVNPVQIGFGFLNKIDSELPIDATSVNSLADTDKSLVPGINRVSNNVINKQVEIGTSVGPGYLGLKTFLEDRNTRGRRVYLRSLLL